MTRAEKLVLALICAAGAFLRFFRLPDLPPGLQFDLAFNAFDLLRLLQGEFALFFPANTGREPLYFYLAIPFAALFGPSALAFKVLGGVVGAVTIPLVYLAARDLFRSAPLALVAAALIAFSAWHIQFSRWGLRVILEVPLTLLTFWFSWRALERGHRRQFLLAGLFLALSLYTYTSARVLPFALVFLTLAWGWFDRGERAPDLSPRKGVQWPGLAFTLGLAALLLVPLAGYFWFHPDEFLSHTVQVSVLATADTPFQVLALIAENAGRIAGMFVWPGIGGANRLFPGFAVFDLWLAPFFLIGLALLFWDLANPRRPVTLRRRSLLLVTWLAATLVTSVLSDDAPNFLRTLPAISAPVILTAWAMLEVCSHVPRGWATRAASSGVVGLVLMSGLAAYQNYFVTFAGQPWLYTLFDVDKVEVSDYLNSQARTASVYLAPLYFHQGTISFLTRNAALRSFDSRDTLVLPTREGGRDALYAFPPEQTTRIQTLETRLRGIGRREDLVGSNGSTILLVYRVPSVNLPARDEALHAIGPAGTKPVAPGTRWDSLVELGGFAIEPLGRGRSPVVSLVLRLLGPRPEDTSFSVQLQTGGRTWGQDDKWLGSNSYPSAIWSAGEVVMERFYPSLDPCAPPGEYTILVQVYDSQSQAALFRNGEVPPPFLPETLHVESSSGHPLAELDPDRPIELTLGPGLELFGWSAEPHAPRPGQDWRLSLYWRGQGETQAVSRARVSLRDYAGRDWLLGERQIPPLATDRGVCTWFSFGLPEEAAAGPATLLVNDAKIVGFNIER